jgi:putative glycosyltransferase (TIGR04372 family)
MAGMKSAATLWLSFESAIRKRSLARKAALAVALVIAFPLSLVLYLLRVRFLRMNAPRRLGHLAAEPDIFIKQGVLGLRRRCYGVLVSPAGTAANECLLDYWARYIKVVRSPFWGRILLLFHRFPYLLYDLGRYTLAINETAPSIAVQRAWADRPTLLSLDEAHRREGRARLLAMGVPPDAEFVCFHCREPGWSPSDEELHSFRNCNVDRYLLAVSQLTSHGFWCIRMGDPSMRRLAPMEKVIDYVHLDVRTDWMDVFLCASCKFFLGSASGLSEVATLFGKSCALANLAPLSALLKYGLNDVAIPKLLWSETESRYLNFREIFASDVSNFRFTDLFRRRGIRLLENTPEDVGDLAQEVLERVEGRAVYTPTDEELQRRFKALMRPGHYSYGGLNRIGREFLRKYAHLIGDS